MVKNQLPLAEYAKITQNDGTGNHAIVVGNRNYTDFEEVKQADAKLRAIGIHTRMVYKPLVFSHLGIYTGSEIIRPIIYKSDYDARAHASKICTISDKPKPLNLLWRKKNEST